ncbi:MAG: hypothetical protein P1V81_09520 [Planctomycetota bacterium]|nr:hypothetical protein [Planctomycetota bacterium]
MPTRPLAGLALALLCASCVTYDYDRFRRNMELEPATFAELVPGESDLTDALAALGAPVRVWEPRPGALALVWSWSDRKTEGFSIAVPTSDAVDASFSWRDTSDEDEGLLLVFDEDWRLETLRRGLVGEVLQGVRRARLVE